MKVMVVSIGVVGVRAAGNLLGDVYSGSCLEGIIQPLLNRCLVGDLVFKLETSEWHSHLISTSIHAILLGEFLGYEVHFNSDGGSTKDVFYRAAEGSERPDGSSVVMGNALEERIRSGRQFVYANMEVWRKGKDSPPLSATLDQIAAGYEGRSGWYVPDWMAEPQYEGNLVRSYKDEVLGDSRKGALLSITVKGNAVTTDCQTDEERESVAQQLGRTGSKPGEPNASRNGVPRRCGPGVAWHSFPR